MTALKGFQRRFLRARAHGLDPVVLVGQRGVTEEVLESIHMALLRHELIKLRFIEGKAKDQKAAMAESIVAATGCALVGTIGHTLILFRPHPEEGKRKVDLPDGAAAPKTVARPGAKKRKRRAARRPRS
jgi:RNA-binding protein